MHILKQIFIPHRGNNYKPHLIKHHVVLGFVLLLLGAQTFFNYQATGSVQILGYATNVTNSDLLALTNQQRISNGQASFSTNAKLNSAAQAKANHMVANNYWAHVAPDGTTPWYFIDNTGYSYKRAGENLAYGFTTSSGVISGWMNSPTHAANILDSGFREVGFGIANGANFQGDQNTVVVAMYGEPTTLTAQPSEPSAQENTPAESSGTEEESNEVAPPKEEPENRENKTPQDELEQNQTAGSDANSQYLLSQLDSASQIQVSNRAASQAGSETITIFEALIRGQAHWFLYVSLGALIMVGIVYLMRHCTALFQTVVHGEHYIEGHPLLEASLIYAVIWLILASTYGVIV